MFVWAVHNLKVTGSNSGPVTNFHNQTLAGHRVIFQMEERGALVMRASAQSMSLPAALKQPCQPWDASTLFWQYTACG